MEHVSGTHSVENSTECWQLGRIGIHILRRDIARISGGGEARNEEDEDGDLGRWDQVRFRIKSPNK
jgi:hypothetical protein